MTLATALTVLLTFRPGKGSGTCAVRRTSVVRWTQAFERQGARGLDSKPQAGGKSRLSARDQKRLSAILIRGPRPWGWSNELWTLGRIAEVIRRRFGIEYSISAVHRIVVQLGFSAQKPARLARERNDEAVEEFRKKRWRAIKKKPGVSDVQLSSSTRAASCCSPMCGVPGRREAKHPSIAAGIDTTVSRSSPH